MMSKIENEESFNIKNILTGLKKKYDFLNDGKRSFLTKVTEKDSSINKNMTMNNFDTIETITSPIKKTRRLFVQTLNGKKL